MTLYERWAAMAYDKDGQTVKRFWGVYMPVEQKIYAEILGSGNAEIKGTVAGLAERFGISAEYACGFLDGIKGALSEELDVEGLTEASDVNAAINFEKLYKKMVEYKAEHLYSLPEWEGIFGAEKLKEMYHEQKRSGTVVREGAKTGRNDPCPCGSGKKYKKCCGIV